MKAARPHSPNAISKRANYLISILFWLYTIACVFPLALVIAVSFTDEMSILKNGYQLFPKAYSTIAYQLLFEDSAQIVRSYGVSLFVTIVGTLLSLLLTAAFAYPISRKELPLRNGFMFFIFFTMLFNGGLVPWYLVYTKYLHMSDSIWALIVPMLVQPFNILIMRTFFQTTIPGALIEAATIDGAGELRIFYKIVLPLSLPVIATISLFNTLMYWNDWFLSLIFISDNETVSVQFLMYKTMLNIQYLTSNVQASEALTRGGGTLRLPSEAIRMAMAVIGIGPIILAYPFFQKYFVKGLTIGAVKG
ncbi:carbohydrate ABC transporter permease [Paenibacillus sp. OV219]|uniref:carbohydrate ABC transporter permease n=1 Tax=Paenibacillus sp. OV219 TaxID=1884377 RepID=UPI0008D8139B|nr:carbohydrate ABC transporter permease [Paenibacillus sp. OV219]SEO90793.1 carbohydrate ABC transporter membrane protein 2, CUT1 family [Paenibacillus sp. OV219]